MGHIFKGKLSRSLLAISIIDLNRRPMPFAIVRFVFSFANVEFHKNLIPFFISIRLNNSRFSSFHFHNQ